MLKMRAEADAANERADEVAKDLKSTSDKLQEVEGERNSLQR